MVMNVSNNGKLLNFLWQRRTLVPEPPYSSDLPPSFSSLFGALKNAVLGKSFESYNEEATEEMKK